MIPDFRIRESEDTDEADSQELASTRHMLNKANDKIRSLTEEIEAYQTIGHDINFNAPTRTRVTRRVPEGTWLGTSVRASSRSVSGSAAR